VSVFGWAPLCGWLVRFTQWNRATPGESQKKLDPRTNENGKKVKNWWNEIFWLQILFSPDSSSVAVRPRSCDSFCSQICESFVLETVNIMGAMGLLPETKFQASEHELSKLNTN
jgi:hypothetical protein